MTTYIGTSPETGEEVTVVVLSNTTPEQLHNLTRILEQLADDSYRIIQSHRDSEDCSNETHLNAATAFNMLCDLGVDGYEI